MKDARAAAADLLIRLRESEDRLETLPAEIRPATIEAGYQIQAALHARRIALGHGPYGGFKIGCTTAVMQAYLNIPEPCGGGVLAGDLHASGASFGPSKRRYGVECEIAVKLAKPLGGDGAPSMAQTRDAVGAVMAAIELVEDRYLEWRTMDAPTLIADDFFQRACVLGDPIADWRDHDLSALIGEMTINGNESLRGRGSDILGHPLEALRWLAGRRVVPAGAIVMLGSVVQTQWLNAGDEAAVSLGGLSAAHLRLHARPHASGRSR
jgi:2-oxo-3-hexenedioate decarboxylase/2-keto-4-pentenoate hydratase